MRSDPLNCTDRATLPQLDNVTTTAWSPDSSTLALVHLVSVPSTKTVTGYEEDQLVSVFDVATGALRDVGHGSRPTWSASGAYLTYWNADGNIRILRSGQVVAQLDASQPGLGWNGDSLLYWFDDEIRVWDSGVRWTLARVESDMAPQYPYDDAYFSADGTEFTLTRYSYDGTSRRYVGTTATGAMTPIGDGNTTFMEWSPRGATLLLRSATALSLRSADGRVQNAALSSFRGTVHGWTADGRLFVGAMSATVPGGNAFDRFAVWNGDDDSIATIPNLLGSRIFSPDGSWFAGVSRTGLYSTQLELYRCGVVDGAGIDLRLRSDTASRSHAQKIATETNRFVRPVAGAFSQFLQGNHTGIDVAAPVGSILVAADDGIVDAVGWVPVGGFRVCVLHAGGLESCDYHTSLPLVSIGDHVARGQPVALVGMTGLTAGPHVHWEAKLDGRIVNPLDQ
ncbi:MAG TPA: peptidoglycan DD-metalloendopeptidase family protein [Candidatus Limnocylindria bacterium]|nr:peptidoglycan DD-metalloendopeptidase family protein [Candidatus Limnocylindria bacterium]